MQRVTPSSMKVMQRLAVSGVKAEMETGQGDSTVEGGVRELHVSVRGETMGKEEGQGTNTTKRTKLGSIWARNYYKIYLLYYVVMLYYSNLMKISCK